MLITTARTYTFMSLEMAIESAAQIAFDDPDATYTVVESDHAGPNRYMIGIAFDDLGGDVLMI